MSREPAMPAKIWETWSRSWTAHVASSWRSVTSPSDGVAAVPVEVAVVDELDQPREALCPQIGEPLDQLVERRTVIARDVREAVERVERDGRAVLKDPLGPQDPVVELRGEQVPDDVPRPPAAVDVRSSPQDSGSPVRRDRNTSGIRRSKSVVSARNVSIARGFYARLGGGRGRTVRSGRTRAATP